MSLNYTTFRDGLANLMGQTLVTDSNFVTMFPNAIDYAEQRIYRDLDPIETIVRDTKILTPNSRTVSLPSTFGTFVVIDGLNLLVGGIRTSVLAPVSREFIDMIYPSDTAALSPSYPQYFSMLSDQITLVAPPPDGAYTIEVVGRTRPLPLTVANPTTTLTTNFPDLFLTAAMVFASGYKQNFSATGDDPRSAMSWEQQYNLLLASAQNEQARKRFASASWSSRRQETPPSPARPE